MTVDLEYLRSMHGEPERAAEEIERLRAALGRIASGRYEGYSLAPELGGVRTLKRMGASMMRRIAREALAHTASEDEARHPDDVPGGRIPGSELPPFATEEA